MKTEDSKKVIEPAMESQPANGSLLILGLNSSEVALFPGWTAIDHTGMPGLAGIASSVTWGNLGNRRQLTVVTISVCASRGDAALTLSNLLEENELTDLPELSNIGDLAFTNPPGTAPAIYFIRGNVCARLSSFGTETVYITDAARTLDALICAYPQSSTPKLTMTSHKTGVRQWKLQISAAPVAGSFFQLRTGVGELTCEQDVPYLTLSETDTTAPVKVYLYQITPYTNVSTVISAVTTVQPRRG